jgi:hypothetical protein
MRELTPEGFDMVVKPVPGAQDASTKDSIIAWSGENFFVPANGENPTGGMEYLRALMSKENAKWFAENVTGTGAAGTSPTEGFSLTTWCEGWSSEGATPPDRVERGAFRGVSRGSSESRLAGSSDPAGLRSSATHFRIGLPIRTSLFSGEPEDRSWWMPG